MSSPWQDVPMQKMHLCPECEGAHLSLLDAQSLNPETHLWVMEAYCPDCQRILGGEVSIYQLSALADAVEESFAEMIETARRLENDENWSPLSPEG